MDPDGLHLPLEQCLEARTRNAVKVLSDVPNHDLLLLHTDYSMKLFYLDIYATDR